MVLDRIKKVNDIKQLNEEELEELQEEIRDFLVENIAKTGGHLTCRELYTVREADSKLSVFY